VIQDSVAAGGLRITARRQLGPHYAVTLHEWHARFLAGWGKIAAAGFDPVFRRMWDFYLSYCEAGFRAGYLDAWQFALHKPAESIRSRGD
jgi:cyclopropane-fatty-acyl-phospholipid synthase